MKRVIAICTAAFTAVFLHAAGPNGESGPGAGGGGSIVPAITNVTFSVSLIQSNVFDHTTTNITSTYSIVVGTTSPSIGTPGTGYSPGDTLSMSTGDPGTPGFQFQVSTVGDGGAVTGITIVNGGVYASIPSTPWYLPCDVTSGSGEGVVVVIDPNQTGDGWLQASVTNTVDYYNTNYVFSTTYNGVASNVVMSVEPTMPWTQHWPASINVSNSIFTVTPSP